MGFEITDGLGTGRTAGVDSSNKLLVRATVESIFDEAVEDGIANFVGTPLITLTNAAESAIFFIQNNEDDDLIMENFFFMATATTGGTTNTFQVNWYRNPTSISSPTTVTPLNQNFGSSNTLTLSSEIGQEAATLTGGTAFASIVAPVESLTTETASTIIPVSYTHLTLPTKRIV